MPSRRKLLAGVSVVGTAALAGCTSALADTSAECSIDRIIDGGVCEIEVTNNGLPGDKRVILETRDAEGTLLGTNSKIVHMGFRETARVNINPEPHSDMEELTVSVESA